MDNLFPAEQHPNLLVGLGSPDDAAVYRLNDEQALIQTVDFFTPIVDTPYEYGAIAAANVLSDVYAMGGEVLFALNIAALPPDLPTDMMAEILRGGADVVRSVGAAIVGGHTIQDKEPKYGLAVTGLVHPDRILTKGGAWPGDALVLTKPLWNRHDHHGAETRAGCPGAPGRGDRQHDAAEPGRVPGRGGGRRSLSDRHHRFWLDRPRVRDGGGCRRPLPHAFRRAAVAARRAGLR